MNITELSKKYDISVRTIRYYEEVGIIESARSEKNVRVYNTENENNLLLILLLKELNFKLSDIKVIVSGKDEAELRGMLIEEKERLDAQINEISKKKQLVSSILNSYGAKEITKRNIKEFIRHQLYVSVKNERLERILMGDEYIMIEIGEKLIPIASKESDSLIGAVKKLRRSIIEEKNIYIDKIRIRDNVAELKQYEYRIVAENKVVVKKELRNKGNNEQIEDIVDSLSSYILEIT